MLTIKQQKYFDGLTEYRAYFFGNMYLSSIQQGIQALHVTSELYTKYTTTTLATRILYRWGLNDKTVILLNGGYSETIQNVYDAFEKVCPKHGFPFAKFHEEKSALNGALTSVGVILPKEVWDCANPWQPYPYVDPSRRWQDFYSIKGLLTSASLAS